MSHENKKSNGMLINMEDQELSIYIGNEEWIKAKITRITKLQKVAVITEKQSKWLICADCGSKYLSIQGEGAFCSELCRERAFTALGDTEEKDTQRKLLDVGCNRYLLFTNNREFTNKSVEMMCDNVECEHFDKVIIDSFQLKKCLCGADLIANRK